MTPGELEMQKLKQAGFGDEDIQSWQTRQSQRLQQGGFSSLEIDNYFGKKDVDEHPIRDFLTKALPEFFTKDYPASPDAFDLSHPIASAEKYDVVKGAEAGVQGSVTGLAVRGKVPEMQAPEGFKGRMGADIGQLAGDAPFMVAGSVIGAYAGAPGGPVTATAAGGAGAFALPEALRTTMMEAYSKGQVKSAGDFLNRVGNVAWATGKAGAVGALTALSGEAAAPLLKGAPAIVGAVGKTGVEAATLTTSQSLIQKGQLPDPQDFEDAGILLFGLHAAGFGAAKLRNIYAKTGVGPSQIWDDARSDPKLKEELVSSNVAVPERYAAPAPEAVPAAKPAETAQEAPPAPAESAATIPDAKAARRATPQRSSRPPDLVRFVAGMGGLVRDQGEYAGHLENLDAHRTFVPGAGMLVRKSGGMNLDHAREIAEEAGYGPYGDIPGFLDGLDNALRGGEEFSQNDIEQYARWKGQETSRQLGDEPVPEPVDQIKEWQAKAEKLGIETHESWTAEDLMASVIEREAMNEGNSEAYHNTQELLLDRYIEAQYPHLAQRLKADGYDSDLPGWGARPETPTGAEAAGREHGSGAQRKTGDAAPQPSAGSPLELTAETGGQTVIPGAEQSAKQLAAARESAGHGRTTAGVNQKEADQGLFAPPDEQPPLLSSTPPSGWEHVEADDFVSFGPFVEAVKVGELSPAEAAITRSVYDLARKIVPSSEVFGARRLRITHEKVVTPEGYRTDGVMYYNGVQALISWSLESADSYGTLKHEAVHWLKATGFLTPEEWQTLERASADGDWISKHNIESRYPEATVAEKIEESIAEEYRYWNRDALARPYDPHAETLGSIFSDAVSLTFGKIKALLQGIADNIRQRFGRDATAQDVFSRIDRGIVGRRIPSGNQPRDVRQQILEQRSPAERSILDRIAEHPTKSRPLTFDRLYIDTVDDLYAVRAMEKALAGKADLRTEESPYQMMRLFRGTAGRVEQFLERAAFRFSDLMTVGKSLKDVLKPVKGDLDGLRAYLVSRRALELENRGIETGVPLSEAQAVVAAGDPKYSTIAQELQDYQRNLMRYLVESGVVAPKTALQIAAANQEYVPFYRLFTEDEGKGGAPKAGGKVRNPVKQIKGSERQILDPLESIVRNTETYIKIAEKNRANRTLTEFAAQYALGSDFVEKVPNAIVPIELSDAELKKFVDENGLAGDPAAFTVFRPRAFQPSPDEIAVWKNGKREVYKVNRELADAVDKMDPQILPWYVRLLALAARGLRAGATLTPDFIMRNLLRDQLTANSLARYRYIPFYDAISGLGSILKKDDDYQTWLKAGGANGAMVSLDRRYMENNVFGIAKETGFLRRTINVVTTPIEMLRIASEIAENATRVGAFKRAYRQTNEPFTAAFEARDITLDFARVGAQMRAANAITAFMNAGVQGVDRVIRAFKENPAGTLARTVAAITVPSVLLWLANRDDPRWKAIPNWEKDLYWLVMTKDHIYRIPKPFELGIVFGTLPERVMDHYYQDRPSSKMFGDLASDVQNGLVPNYIPTLALPMFESFANRSMFSGQHLIPASMEKVLPEYQYTDYTTETAKRIGHFIALMPGMKESQFASPILMENYIRDWGGGMGMYMLQASDFSLRKAGILNPPPDPSPTLADDPFIKAFAVRYPSASAQPLQDFWDRYGRTQSAIATIQALAKRGEPLAAIQEQKIAQQSGMLVRLSGIQQGLSAMTKQIHLITIDPSMKPEEKRQMIDGLYYTMIRGAEAGNKLTDQIDAAIATRH